MTLGAETTIDDIWADAPAEALARAVKLARGVSQASAARVAASTGPAGAIVRGVADPDGRLAAWPYDGVAGEPTPMTALSVPLVLSSGQEIGALQVFDAQPREWPPDTADLLCELAAALTREMELTSQLRHEQAVASHDRLLEAIDRIPALVFERRKIDAARSSYTFFGTRKTQLPAIRKMMEGDGAAGDLGFLHHDDRELVRDALLRSNLEETDLDLTFRIKDLDGSIRWLRSQSFMRREPDRGVYWHGFVFDVSDLVGRQETESARADRDAFMDDLGRELSAPLKAISGFTHALEGEQKPEAAATLAKNIQFAAEALLAAVNRILAAGSGTNAELAESLDDSFEDEAEAPGSSTSIDGSPLTPAPGAGRILLADDLDLNRKLIADVLSLEGHVVDCVADGEQAVKAAREGRFDLILMDMVMPGMDGIAATQAIRSLPKPACHVPIVALTANSSPDQLEHALLAGMNATLTKPMSVNALHAAVSAWIRRRYEAA